MDNTDSNNYEPDDFEKDLFRSLQEKHMVLLSKFKNRKRSPLKFVEAFDAFSEDMKAIEMWQWPAITKTISRLKASAEALRPEYKSCLPRAESQRERNEYWNSIYHPPPSFLPGGRADGNS